MSQLLLKIGKLASPIKNYDWLNKNDLFVLIKYGDQVCRTTTKWNDNQPEWNESFIFHEKNDNIEICLYDEDSWSKDEIVKHDFINPSDINTICCEIEIKIELVKCVKIDELKKVATTMINLKDVNNELKHKAKYLEDKLNQIKSIIEN